MLQQRQMLRKTDGQVRLVAAVVRSMFVPSQHCSGFRPVRPTTATILPWTFLGLSSGTTGKLVSAAAC